MFLNFLNKNTRENLRELNGLKLPEPVVTGMTPPELYPEHGQQEEALMFQEEKIPAKTREELIQLVKDSFNLGYWQLLMAFGDKDLREKFPEEHKRFKDELDKLQKVENYIHEVCFKDKWSWNRIALEAGHKKAERQQAMTTSLMFFYNRMKRWNDVLFKRYESIFKYCEENNIDIKLNH